MFQVVKNGAIKISLRAATRAVKSCIVSVDAVVQASAHYSSAAPSLRSRQLAAALMRLISLLQAAVHYLK